MAEIDKDLEEIAKTATDDFYELLGVAFDVNEAQLKSAYRKASVKAHPDKNPDLADAADKFIRLGIARDILIDAHLKSEYDKQRARKRERTLQNDLLDGKRRKMKEDLERREREGFSGVKRKRGEMTEAEKRDAEIQRLAEDGKRRRKEYEEKLQRQRQEEEASFMETPSAEPETVKPPQAAGQSAEIDRTVRVRFQREGDTLTWDKETISSMFTKFGKIDSLVMGKDKKVRLSGEKHRKTTATVFIVFTRIDHAYTAVTDARTHYPQLESVTWASKEPDLKSPPVAAGFSAPSTPVATPNKAFRALFGGSGLPRGLGSTPGTPKFAFSPNSPSLQEHTMMRLKQAEKKKLEEQIRRQEAAEEEAGA